MRGIKKSSLFISFPACGLGEGGGGGGMVRRVCGDWKNLQQYYNSQELMTISD